MKLTVYEVTSSDPGLRVVLMRVEAEPVGNTVRVQERFAIENPSRPPRTFAGSEGAFSFRAPPQVTKPIVAVTGLMDMELPQTAEKGKLPGEFSLRYPFKPGLTVVTVRYKTDYDPAGFALTSQVSYSIDLAELYVRPANTLVGSESFRPSAVKTKNGMIAFEVSKVPAGSSLEARLSSQRSPLTGHAEPGPREGQVITVPNSMTRLAGPLLVGFLLPLLCALGIQVAKERRRLAEQSPAKLARKTTGSRIETLLNSLADLDELFAAGKIVERKYRKERLESKAKLVAILKKSPPAVFQLCRPTCRAEPTLQIRCLKG